jgi:hypothetical protein
LERAARLQDELHAIGEQIIHLAVDRRVVVDPDELVMRRAAHEELTPEQLLFRLDLTGERVVATIESRSDDEWRRAYTIDEEPVALGALVERMLDDARGDLLAPDEAIGLVRPGDLS